MAPVHHLVCRCSFPPAHCPARLHPGARAVITGASVLATVGMVAAGFTRSDSDNLTADFAPFGAAGIADGAAYVFAAFVGFQLIPALAEEVRLGAGPWPEGAPGGGGGYVWRRGVPHCPRSGLLAPGRGC